MHSYRLGWLVADLNQLGPSTMLPLSPHVMLLRNEAAASLLM
jgi:hypothetical protein